MERTGTQESDNRQAALARLAEQAEAVLALIPEDGSTIGNGRLRGLSGLDEATYRVVILGLEVAGKVLRGPRRGGSVRRVVLGDAPPPSPTTGAGARPRRARTPRSRSRAESADAYVHTEEAVLRPDAGTQTQFKKQKPAKSYAYDSSLSPSLEWAGKAERLSFDVPTLPLFVHERLSTRAIIQTLTEHKRDRQLEFQLFADPQLSLAQQLESYEHTGGWVNRLVLGDSLVVMNSLLEYEGLGGQVQMIYIDPPYGVKFGSNFQPFVRKRDVTDGSDEDLTREPEMVKAYRDTWELGLHSYLTYLRDRLLLSRELLAPSGSIFVQISDANLHHAREVMDEVFGPENFVVTILIKKKGGQKGNTLDPINDYLVWFAKDKEHLGDVYTQLYTKVELDRNTVETFNLVQMPAGADLSLADLSKETGIDYRDDPARLFSDYPGARLFTSENLTSGGFRKNQSVIYEYEGTPFDPGIKRGNCWKHTAVSEGGTPSGLDRLAAARRLYVGRKQLRYKRFLDDFGYTALSNWWDGIAGAKNPIYVVQTNVEIVKRCMLMSTRPGDLVLDPTCGSGTTAYAAEQWGRRWITIDASRVPIALARQRLLTSTFEFYELQGARLGPAGGFVYKGPAEGRRGGVVPHITSSTIANNEPPETEVLVDRPEVEAKITRVAGPFCVEATIPTPLTSEASEDVSNDGTFVDRLVEVLRLSPVLQLAEGGRLTLDEIRRPTKALTISAEASIGDGTRVAVSSVRKMERSPSASSMRARAKPTRAASTACS